MKQRTSRRLMRESMTPSSSPSAAALADVGRLGVGLYLHALLGLKLRHVHLPSCLSHLAATRRISNVALCALIMR